MILLVDQFEIKMKQALNFCPTNIFDKGLPIGPGPSENSERVHTFLHFQRLYL